MNENGATENAAPAGRKELKEFFRNGKIVNENDFGVFIESVVNKHDDGFARDVQNGFIIKGSSVSKNLVSFYKALDELYPFFSIASNDDGKTAIAIQPRAPGDNNGSTTALQNGNQGDSKAEQTDTVAAVNSFFFHPDGSLGVGKTAADNFKLDVNGFAAFKGRIGTYKQSSIPADGRWHPILENLDGCQAFEVIAKAGKPKAGRFAILHAFALSAFGGDAKSRIRKTSSYYGFPWNKIQLKWTGTTHNYALNMRTGRNYGDEIITYYITKLWEDSFYNVQEPVGDNITEQIEGLVTKVEQSDFLTISIKAAVGNTFKFVVLDELKHGEWMDKPEQKLLKRNVRVSYTEKSIFLKSKKSFANIKRIKELKFVYQNYHGKIKSVNNTSDFFSITITDDDGQMATFILLEKIEGYAKLIKTPPEKLENKTVSVEYTKETRYQPSKKSFGSVKELRSLTFDYEDIQQNAKWWNLSGSNKAE